MIQIKTLARRIIISDFIGNFLRFLLPKIWIKDLRLDVSSRYIRGKVVSLIWLRKYEQEEVRMLEKYLDDQRPIVELGSSIGIVALNAIKKSSSTIFCVEANPNLVDIISTNFQENNVSQERYTVINAAISEGKDDGKMRYFLPRESNELGRLCDKETEGAIRVPTISLSRIVKNCIQEEYVLVSDIEGAEVAFLFEDAESLLKCKQLFIELHPVIWNGIKYEVTDLVRRIESLGYKKVEQQAMNFYFECNEAA